MYEYSYRIDKWQIRWMELQYKPERSELLSVAGRDARLSFA